MRKKLPGRLKGFLAAAVLVSGITLALAIPAGANAVESTGWASTAMLVHPLAADPAVAPTMTAVPPTRTAPPLSLTVMLICTGGALALVFVVIILGFILGMGKQKQRGG